MIAARVAAQLAEQAQTAGLRALDAPVSGGEQGAIDAALSAQPDATRVAAYQAPYQRFLRHLEAVRPLYTA